MVEVNQDVANTATTESVSTMKLKTLLHSCTMDNVNIVLFSYSHKPNYTVEKTNIKIRSRNGFSEFIDTYGESDVCEWKIESVNGTAWMLFDLQNLVMKGMPTVKPKSRNELIKIIDETIKKEGNNCDLNFIDVSLITDMSCLFQESEFNGNISKWDVSKVKDMSYMFEESEFNGDISNWDVSNVRDMKGMFEFSKFNGNISNWNVSKVEDMRAMFYNTYFNGDVSKWNVSSVKDMECMFQECPLEKNPPEWY